jgi:uncharacterized protein
MAHTSWGELRVSDAHVHFFSHAFYAGLARQKKLQSLEELQGALGWNIPTDAASLADRWVVELDRYRVDRACLIASAHGDEVSVAAAVSQHPNRFFGYFMLDPLQPNSLERIQAAASNPHLHCVCLFPAMHNFSIADARLLPMFEIASDHGLAMFVHCGALSVGVRKRLGLPSHFDMRFSNPLDLHPIALHFPRVRFVVPHFGAGMFREALMLADLCPNVYLDTSSSNRWMLYEGLELRTVFRRALDVLGPERLIFGSDSSFFPRGWHATILEQQATALYELGLNEDTAEKIFSTNLQQLLGQRTNSQAS